MAKISFDNNTALPFLATTLGRRDEVPNQQLAERIIKDGKIDLLADVAKLLQHPKKEIQFDAIKTMYEVATQQPDWVAPYVDTFIQLLESKHNRMVWGAMTALSAIATNCTGKLFEHILLIVDKADSGSVITRDHAVNILIELARHTEYNEIAAPLLLEQILKSPENQFPTYAEKSIPLFDGEHKQSLLHVLTLRKQEMVTPSKIKRVTALIQKLERNK